ncbi:helix-turn-helix domain-containing protein [Actinomycetospora termitidis]|uniref:AraC family transcriptional regulator n=1 Tax=Actinomycetospora termitidis TaxID=3053470 RepID=A0ABT7M483_9PSEU|nr:AraC family transcriptional regulator [Actinomycetospora sp. Odt1-22]MDL5154827.1 AraC family transcriptional regulator [Actinomycetospora sp. Odt1-22]
MFLVADVPAPLRGVVRRLVAYDERATDPVRRRQAPGATCTLVIGLADPLLVDGTALGSFAGGLTDVPALTEFRGHQRGLQADLTPGGALRLFGTPLPGTVPLDALGPAWARLPGRLAELPGWAARLTALAGTLTALLDGAPPDPEVRRAWSLLESSAGRVPVGSIAADVGWSRRHLSRRFGTQLGLSPTTAGRVLRFRRAADLLVPPAGTAAVVRRIADVAADCGFADHAHLDREFAALAGCSPRAYVAGWADVAVDPAEVTRTP